jgi:dTMP kinase
LVSEVIEPALARGATVLCDRFSDSTMAYQGIARGLGLELVQPANQLGSKGLVPRRTIVLTCDPKQALERATEEGADRLEAEGLAFHQRVVQGFEQLARQDPQRVRLVASRPEKHETADVVFEQVKDLFPAAAKLDFQITDQLLERVRTEHD